MQNAFKFTLPGGEVRLTAYADADRILVDVEDGCGGLPDEDPESLFLPFVKSGTDRSGAGLGLVVARRSVEANEGTLTARNNPGIGCVFTISLARNEMPAPLSASSDDSASVALDADA